VGQEDEGGVGGSRTSVVFVQVTKHVEREEEFFATKCGLSSFSRLRSYLLFGERYPFLLRALIVLSDLLGDAVSNFQHESRRTRRIWSTGRRGLLRGGSR
jgi:hypothetical protein